MSSFFSKKLAPILPHPLTLLSSLLLVICFPPWNLWPCIWVCLIPWFWVLKNAPHQKAALREGFWLGYGMTLGGFYWVAYALQEYGNLPWPISVLGLLLFCCVGQLQFVGISGVLFHRLRAPNSPLHLSLGLAFFYTGLDWVLPKIFADTLGHCFYQAPYFRQLADLTTAYGLTFLAFFMNLTLFEWAMRLTQKRKFQFHAPAVISLLLCLSAWIYGSIRAPQLKREINAATSSIQLAAIQANIGDLQKLAAERNLADAALDVMDRFTRLSEQALQSKPSPQAILWPETSYPAIFGQPTTELESILNAQVERIVQKYQVPLWFGGYDRMNHQDFNSFFFLEPQGALHRYHKNRILLFGEYIPGSEWFPLLREAFPQVGNFGRGPGPQVFSLQVPGRNEPLRVAPTICYEGLFTDFLVQASRMGGELILNITNDSWFGPTSEPHLHLALTVFRAIETHLPLLRSTNTGISALITADGEITSPTNLGTEAILSIRIPLTRALGSLVKQWGDWFGPFSLIIGLLLNLSTGFPSVQTPDTWLTRAWMSLGRGKLKKS
ncbi:MAG: apolipoprotein N-acyltransferase [Bdellovibrionia bacterium]